MIGMQNETANLASAIAALDFSDDNADLTRLKAEQAACGEKDAELRRESTRLADAIRDFTGPDPEALASAMLGGASIAEATKSTTSRADLAAQREAVISTLGALGRRSDAIRGEIDQVNARARRKILVATERYREGLAGAQVEAAKTIVEADAALQALKDLTRCYLPEEPPSRAARKGMTGPDTLLGIQHSLEVPQALLAAIGSIEQRCHAVSSMPSRISIRGD